MPVFCSAPATLALAAILTATAVLPPLPAVAEQGASILRIAAPIQPSPDLGTDDASSTADPADGPEAGKTATDCVDRYQAALQRIKSNEFAALSATRSSTAQGDKSLPGTLIFTPKASPRSRSEMSALSTAATLARSRGRPTASADAAWVAQRLSSDLSDYLGQKATPYLCSGVPQYIATLRRFGERTGNGPQRLQSLFEAQTDATRRSVEAAFTAMKPVPAPNFAPDDRPSGDLDAVPTGTISGLRPAVGMTRAATLNKPIASAPVSENAAGDPDLPPLKPSPPRALATPADRAATVDHLLASARSAGMLAPLDAGITEPDISTPTEHPVLMRLERARATLRADPADDGSQSVRLSLASAFADIEALDYLDRATGEKGDPQTLAVNAVFEAILAAQAKECTCAE